MKRCYRVVVQNSNGLHAWESYCSGFYIGDRVSPRLIREWESKSKQETGLDGIVISFTRLMLDKDFYPLDSTIKEV